MSDFSDAVVIDRRQRSFTCHVPPASTPHPQALLILLHGRNLTVPELRMITHFDAIADRHGFVAVYPEGYERSWNDARGNTPAERDGVDDVAFIRVLIDHLIERRGIDPGRVGVAGLSNGGVMCHRLGLELGDQISAIASVAGLMPVALADVVPDYAVSALLIHGTRDGSVPIEGGQARGLARALLYLGGVRVRASPVLSLAGTVDRWRSIDGCVQETCRDYLSASDRDRTSVEWVSYEGGQGGTAVESRIIEGGGHTWPGGSRLPGLGRTTTRFDAGEVIWQFASSHWHPAIERRRG